MSLRPNDWNVVIAGYWNLAILSPAGIARRVFRLPEETPVEVLVPLDGVAPLQVRHNGIGVVPSKDRLVVVPQVANASTLDAAKAIAANILRDLPETPVHAIGVNIRFKSVQSDLTDNLLHLLEHDSDNRLSDSGFAIISRSLGRSVPWNGGVLNISVTEDDKQLCHVLFNFDLKSNDFEALSKWVERPSREFLDQVEALIQNYFSAEIEVEMGDTTDD